MVRAPDDTAPAALARITMPTLVVCGAADQDNGSAPDLAAALPEEDQERVGAGLADARELPPDEIGEIIARA